jgi:hypothetical protein
MQLAEIAERHACDKGRVGPSSRWIATNYADIYQAYLHHRRNEPISLLEIGLGVTGPNWRADVVHGRNMTGGASLKMWADYLPNATITGVDINPAKFLDSDRITTYQVDQGSREQLAQFIAKHPNPRFDIIIDDGSHRGDHQQVTLEVLFPHLKPDGLYFIEDLNDFGYGARRGSRHGSPETVTTRDFFKRYEQTGEIAEPNAFQSTAFLSDIAEIMFYSPRPMQRPRDLMREAIRTLIGRGSAGISRFEWARDSELVLALRKKG